MPNEPFAKGHCLCGAVSYTINANPLRMAQCHCKDCQRASGTGHMQQSAQRTKHGVIADRAPLTPSSYAPGRLLRTRAKYITAKAANSTPPTIKIRIVTIAQFSSAGPSQSLSCSCGHERLFAAGFCQLSSPDAPARSFTTSLTTDDEHPCPTVALGPAVSHHHRHVACNDHGPKSRRRGSAFSVSAWSSVLRCDGRPWLSPLPWSACHRSSLFH